MSLAASAAAFGVRGTLPYLAGIVAGTIATLLLIATGVAGLILAMPGAAPFLVAAGVIFILYLAWSPRSWCRWCGRPAAPSRNPRGARGLPGAAKPVCCAPFSGAAPS
jgi:threonine/homoserine/homoserine lactone efflux protein